MSLQDWGWGLFTVSAVGFVAAGVRERDPLLLVASFAFLLACVLFLLDRR